MQQTIKRGANSHVEVKIVSAETKHIPLIVASLFVLCLLVSIEKKVES